MVIDFFATWCGPCVMLSKVLEQLATELGESVDFVKVDTDEEVELSTYFQVCMNERPFFSFVVFY
jgi:thiol-disulfide isomerase/thioredoxin